METVIEGKYKLVAIIARGGFGETYEAVNLKTGQSVAVKFEKITSKHQQLFLESKIYSLLLSGVDITDQGVPQVHYTGTAGDYNVMVMDLLGPSLEKQLKYCQGTFTIKTVLMLGDQMLKRLEMIHSKNLLHRDVKPENFLLGRADRKKKLYVIDFGLAKRYQIQGKHIKYADKLRLVGTARYSSINVHLGIEPTRRDDLQSLMYCLVYFAQGKLPWQGVKANSFEEKCDKILAKKIEYQPETLCRNMPKEFTTIFRQIRSLGFEDKPNYELLKNQLRHCMNGQGLEYDFHYDWDVIDDEKLVFNQV